MTPKEKAQELVDKMYNLMEDDDAIAYSIAKDCGLIAVDEILDTIMSVYQPETKKFWYEVKQEIEKL